MTRHQCRWLLPGLWLAAGVASAQSQAPPPPAAAASSRTMDLRRLGPLAAGPTLYDAASIVRNGPVVSIRLAMSPMPADQARLPGGGTAGSVALDVEIDCQARRMRTRTGTAYAQPGLAGAVLQQMPGEDWQPIEWHRTPPGLYTLTCGAAPR